MTRPTIERFESEKSYYDPESESLKSAFPFMKINGNLDLSVIVPSYNEEERLPGMLDETIEFLEKRCSSQKSYTYEILVVDDGSKDTTSEVAQKYTDKYGSDKIRVLTLKKNKGKGGAVKLGMFSSRGKYLLMADADAATRFSDICKLETEMEKLEKAQNEMAIVVGSRSHLEKDSIANRSLFRTFLMKGFHFLVWLLCVRTVNDTQCGFKLLNRKAMFATFLNLHVERWAFDVELLYIAERLKVPISEVAVYWTEIDGSKMVPVFSWIEMGWDLILIYIKHLTNIWQIENYD